MKRYRQSKVVLTEYQVLSEMREDPEGEYFLVRDVQKRDMVYDELRAEVERLRASPVIDGQGFRVPYLENQLATANALLVRYRTIFSGNTTELSRDTDAHLPAQPATDQQKEGAE